MTGTRFPKDGVGRPLSVDAFGRLRVGEPQTLFDSKQVSSLDLPWTTGITGSGVVGAVDLDRASRTLSVGAGAGTSVRRSRGRFNYTSGQSQYGMITANMAGIEAGVFKRMGQFDAENGYFLELGPTGPSFVIRSFATGAAVDNAIAQADWSHRGLIDKALGYASGGAQNTLDWGANQILWFDYEWLGTGTVRFGFVIDGQPVVAHVQHHANVISGVYLSNPNNPMRYEIESDGTGAGGTLETICCMLAREGSLEPSGMTTALLNPEDKSIATGAFYPLIQIRLRGGSSGYQNIVSEIESVITLAGGSNKEFSWALLLNPTIADTNADWNAETNSSIEVDYAETAAVTGYEHRLDGGHGSSVSLAQTSGKPHPLGLGTQFDGTHDVIALCAEGHAAGGVDLRGGITLRELT